MKQIKEYKESINKIKEYHNNKNKLQEEEYKQKRETEQNFYKLEREIREQKYKEITRIETEFKQKQEQIKEQTEQNFLILTEYKKIINYMNINKHKKTDLKSFEVYYYDYEKDEKGNYIYKERVEIPYNHIDILEEKEELYLKAYITKNRKPKNKYSLIIIGNTIFKYDNYNKTPLNIPYSYGIDAHTENANIRTQIKDFETQKDALNYYERNKSKILKDLREEHKKVFEEFKEIIKLTNTKEWEKILIEEEK